MTDHAVQTIKLALVNGESYSFPAEEATLVRETGWLVVRHPASGDELWLPSHEVEAVEIITDAPRLGAEEEVGIDVWVVEP